MKVWVVSGHSESGDDYGPYVFSKKPSKKALRDLAYSWDGDEEGDNGPGDYGSYVHLSVSHCIVR